MTPYYQHDGITIYHGDCADVLPTLARFDLLLTDPPYGIGKKWTGGSGHGWGKADKQKATRNDWDSDTPSRALIDSVVALCRRSIIWGGNYFELPPSRCWLVWNKPERNFTLAEAELAWTNADNVARVFDCKRSDRDRTHPTQKPLALMRWCLTLAASEGATIFDPFMGSATTLMAAKLAGMTATGIEINEAYCEIAANRLSQGVLF